nr:hypothetical protein [uncultured Comamonas sp.]
MAKFLNTSAINYFLEALIKSAKDRLVLISPFLKLNDRIRELLEENRLKIDVRTSMERVSTADEEPAASDNTDAFDDEARPSGNGTQKISTSKIAQKHGMKTADWLAKPMAVQLLTTENGLPFIKTSATQTGI